MKTLNDLNLKLKNNKGMTKEECVRLNLHLIIIRDGICAYCGKE